MVSAGYLGSIAPVMFHWYNWIINVQEFVFERFRIVDPARFELFPKQTSGINSNWMRNNIINHSKLILPGFTSAC